MRTEVWLKSLNEGDDKEVLGVNGRIILKWNSGKLCERT
jgi:hypothetical protein